jgi:hypothetical protein
MSRGAKIISMTTADLKHFFRSFEPIIVRRANSAARGQAYVAQYATTGFGDRYSHVGGIRGVDQQLRFENA